MKVCETKFGLHPMLDPAMTVAQMSQIVDALKAADVWEAEVADVPWFALLVEDGFVVRAIAGVEAK